MKRMWRSGVLLLAMAAPAFSMTPAAGQAMRPMQFLVGTWDCAGRFPASGKPIASTIRFDFDLDGTVLVKHHDDKPPNGYHAVEDWVAKREGGGYVAAIVDSYSGVREFRSPGWKGGALTWQSAPGITPVQRFVYTRLDDGAFRLDWDYAKDGSNYVVGDTLACKRRGSA